MLRYLIPQVLSVGAALLVGAAATSADDTVAEGCVEACSQLSTIFGPDLHYPDSDNFTIWDAKQLEVHPACRVEPSGATEVSQIMEVVVDTWCRFAVKGGGHSRHPDDSNSIGGVTIDLAKLNNVEPSSDGKQARVGGGATSTQVFDALESRKLSFVGGRVGSVGIGGFTLGGGTSPFSNKYGWALDNVFEYEVVLANGTIVSVSESDNPDLYFALRGGSNNYGIATTFTVRTFPQGPIFTAQVSYSDNQSEAVLDKVYDLYTRPDLAGDLEMGYDLYYTYSPENDGFIMLGTQRYEQPLRDPPVFREIDTITPVSRDVTIGTLGSLISDPPLGETRNLFQTLSVLPSRKLLSKALEIFREEVRAVKTVEGLVPNFICYPLHSNAIAVMEQRGGNALGIEQDGPLFVILISTSWSNPDGDDPVGTMTTNIADRVKAAAVDFGVSHPYLYVGYARSGQDDEVFAGYGKKNLQRLKEIQESVDPRGIFTSHGLWKGHMKLT